MKKVSIVLPVFNGENYLEQALDSILAQTYTEWELIVVDDRSRDRTPEILKAYAARDPRIRVKRNKKNRKLPRSLNIGFLDITGEYLTWTSHDNRYDPEALERMVNALEENSDAVLVCADMRTIDEDGNVTGEIRLREPEDIYLTNTVGACFLYRATCIRRVGGYDTELFLAEDYDYWIRLSKIGMFLHLGEILYSVRTHKDNLSTVRAKESNIAYVKVVRKHFKYLYDHLDTRERQDELINEFMNRAVTWRWRNRAINTICKRRRDYRLRVWHGNLVALFNRFRGGV